MSKVGTTQAHAVLGGVRAEFGLAPMGSEGPQLRGHDHECLRPGSWSIDWALGPRHWPETFARHPVWGQLADVRIEPIDAHTIGLYRS